MIAIGFSTQSGTHTISAIGAIDFLPTVNVSVDASKRVGTNNLSLGFMLDWHRWVTFENSPTRKQMAQDAGFKLVRVFDFRKISSYGYPNLMPCTSWNESTKTGTWDWTQVDGLARTIFGVGAQPLFCLGYATTNIQNYIPPGMTVNSTTELPNPQSYAAYAKEWVKHFRIIGLPVRYYQIMNEPYHYFGWSPSPKLGYYADLWNTAARTMRSENSNISLSQDSMTVKMVLDYWLTHGDNVDFLDFHKYDSGSIGQYSDAEMFNRAETVQFETLAGSSYYGVDDARQKWLAARGRWLPIINSESNFGYAWETGTDPKIQQIAGAVWLALVLRTAMLKGLTYSVYFEFSSSKSQQQAQGTGWGFGMINEDNNQPWLPYYVNKMIGDNLGVADEIVTTQSSSNDIRTVAWLDQGKINILLISKANAPRSVILQGTSGQINVSWVDNMTSYQTPSLQTGKINSSDRLTMNSYTVALLQLPLT
jgi:hypothetical protein